MKCEFGEPLLGFLHQVGGVDGPFQILSDVDSKELDITYTLHLLTVYVERGRYGLPGSPQIDDDLFGFYRVKSWLLSEHHSTRCCTSSLSDISPTVVVSSANFTCVRRVHGFVDVECE